MSLHEDETLKFSTSEEVLYSPIPEYLDDPNEQMEDELGFLSSPISTTSKINRLVEMLKYYKNHIRFLEDAIRKHEMNKSLGTKIDSFPNLSLIAKEFGKFFLCGSEEEWLCIKCMETIKFAINSKEIISKPSAIVKLEINHINEPNLEIDNKNSAADWEMNYIDEELSNTNFATVDTQLNYEAEDSSNDLNSVSTNKENDIESLNELDLELLEVKFSTADLGKYHCEICKATTSSYQKLISHLRRHQGVHIYECERCGKGFSHGHNYKDHILVYQDERPHICEVCGKGFKTPKYLKRHQLSHLTERIVPCPHCDRMFCHQKGLQEHCLQLHIERTCPDCNEIFKNSVLLRRHLSSVHSKSMRNRTKLPNGESALTERLPCGQCEKTFLTKANLILHYKNIHKKERKHSCPCCGKSFFTTQVLRSHMQSHINENENNEIIEKYARYKCDECDRTFTVLSMYREHKTLHSGLKEHSCQFCGKAFAFKIYLSKHVRLMHNTADPKNSVCSYCGKVSANKAALKSHMLTHTGETPFSCTMCDSKFRYAKSLRLHMKNKHNSGNV